MTERKHDRSVQGGEHTGTGRGCRGRPHCGTVHEKTERRKQNQTTCQQSTKRRQSEGERSMASWEHSEGDVCGGEAGAGDGRKTGQLLQK